LQLLKEITRHPGMRTEGKTVYREAVRGIIRDGQKLLMIYSTQNGDYKFPGGGVDAGETHQQALAREIHEECGAVVAKIGPGFGKIIEYDIPVEPEYAVFKMTSFYYRCQVEDGLGAQRLDDYEQEMGFQPVWIEIEQALQTNRTILQSKDYADFPWVPRDTFVLDLLLQENFMPDYFDESTGILLKAIEFSASKHRDQRRKDQPRSPYINHPIRVAQILWEIGGVRDVATLVAAILHDTIEDTETSTDEIRGHFGEEILSLVLEVTDDKSLPKQARKRLQIEHAPRISQKAKLVKLADKICNLDDLLTSPPQRWSFERKRRYLLWTEQVVAGLRGANAALEHKYDMLLLDGKNKLRHEQ